ARRVVLAYDADAAGQSGASRVYEWERGHQVDVAVAALPPGADPGDLGRDDPEALRTAVASARPFLGFRVDRVLAAADLRSAEGRAKAAERAVAVVAEHPNELVRDQYLMQVADRCRLEPGAVRALADRLSRVGAPAAVAQAVSRGGESGPRGATPGNGRRPGPATGAGTPRPGLEALRLAVHRPQLVADRLEAVLFADDLQRAAFELLAHAEDLHEAVEAAEGTDPRVASLLRRVAVEEPASDADDVVVTLVRHASRRELLDVEAQARLSPDKVGELAPEIARVRRDLDELDADAGDLAAVDRLLAWLVGRGEAHD
ncbi:MAG TPA: hypothetical protein VMB72_16795, partial [Acidimicrobiales bacterium]|nr:hypothetical protein [Acidimicrobiales bacterium]